MAKRSMKERMMQALEARGWSVDRTSAVRRYVVMIPTSGMLQAALFGRYGEKCKLYLGPSGALRFSRHGTVATTIPWEKTKIKLLEEVPE